MTNLRQRLFVYNLIFWCCHFISCQSPKITWDIRDYGAVNDSSTINTDAIQNAIDACNKAGGGTVLIDEGVYLTGTILLKNKVELHLTASAKLIGSGNPLDYQSIDEFVDATGQPRGKCLIGALDAQDIAITGKGTIDGRGELFRFETIKKTLLGLGIKNESAKNLIANRPFLVRMVRSKNIKIEHINLRQSAAWALHFYQCQQIVVDNIDIFNHAHHNNDGIDLDSSQDVVVKNCNIDTGDDAICFKTTSPTPTKKIKVRNCKLKSDWGAIKFGTESMGDFQHIDIKNCIIHDTRGGGIKILSVDGANISDIRIDSIKMTVVDMPIFIRLGERLRTYRDATVQNVGTINNIVISNIKAKTRDLQNSRISPPAGIFITGTPNHKIGNLHLDNIVINLPGGGKEEHRNLVIVEAEKDYPEFSFFGILPSYGLFSRHVENLSVSNFTTNNKNEDKRDPVKYSDVDQIDFTQVIHN